jgi:hypothetical protein
MIKKLVLLTLLLAATVSGALTPRNAGAAVLCPDDCRPDDCCRHCWYQFGGCVCNPEYICF